MDIIINIIIDIIIIAVVFSLGAFDEHYWKMRYIMDSGPMQVIAIILILVIIQLIINIIYRIILLRKMRKKEQELKEKEKEWKNLGKAQLDMQKIRDKEQDAQIKAIEKELEELKRARGR